MGDYNAKVEIKVTGALNTNTDYNPASWRWNLTDVVRGYDRQCRQIVKAVDSGGTTVNLSEYAGDSCKLLVLYNTDDSTDVTLTVTIGTTSVDIPIPAEEACILPTFDASTNLVLETASGTANVELLVCYE